MTDLRIAIAHADFGARRNSLTDARVHLALALNCIEGSSSVNSSPFRGNVCGEGNGILMNLRAVPGGAALIPLAQHADHLAAAALRTQNLSQTRYAALNVAILLRRIANGLR